MKTLQQAIRLLFCALLMAAHAVSPCTAEELPPVYIGFDAEQSHTTSTSDDAIRIGSLAAIDEINGAGGVLGGRKLELIIKDNRSVPARGVKNIEEFATVKDLVAVLGGKFSPVMIDELDVIHAQQMILLDVWGAADIITDHDRKLNFCFRVSLKDSWAIEAMIDFGRSRGAKNFGVLLPVTGWGRSCEKAIQKYLDAHSDINVTDTQWYNWGDKSLLDKYELIKGSGAQMVLLIANEAEGSILVKEMAALPEEQQLPIISHWGVSGGNFTQLTGESIDRVDFAVVQTYSFFDQARPEKLKQFYATAKKLFNIAGPENIPSPVGVAHAYDAVHLLALAIDKAGTTDRRAVRSALEQIDSYDGLIKFYHPPFTEQDHTALKPGDLFFGRFNSKDDSIRRIR